MKNLTRTKDQERKNYQCKCEGEHEGTKYGEAMKRCKGER